MLVSIIVNCFNGQPYLKQCLDSIFSQTYSNFEVIFVDNQSTDGSDELAKSYGPKLRYFKTPSLMQLYAARNFAIEKIQGNAVAFLDADDYWHPHKLEKQIPLLAHAGIVYTAVQFIDADGHPLEHYPSPLYYRGTDLTGRLLKRNFISMSSSLVAADLLKKTNFDPYYLLLGDFNLWATLTQFSAVDFCPEKLSFYRVYPTNTSHKNLQLMPIERRHFYRQFLRDYGLKFPEILLYAAKSEIKALLESLRRFRR